MIYLQYSDLVDCFINIVLGIIPKYGLLVKYYKYIKPVALNSMLKLKWLY